MKYTETIIISIIGSFIASYLYNNLDNLKLMKKHNRKKKYPNTRAIPRSSPSNKRPFTSKR